MKMKKLLALLLTLVMLVGMLPTVAVADGNKTVVTEAELATPIGTFAGDNIYLIKVSSETNRLFFKIANAWPYIDKASDFETMLAYDSTELKYYMDKDSENYATAKADYESSATTIQSNATLSDTTDHLLIQAYYDDDSIAYILVEWAKSSGSATAQKTALSAEIAKVTGDNAANFYQSGDRYNGNPDDTITNKNSGFWAVLTAEGGPLASAQTVYENTTATQDDVDAATTALTAAIAKLIPTTQLNATYLYETIQSYTYGESTLANMTEYTAGNYRTAFAAAREYFYGSADGQTAGLFDADGAPTAKNIPDNQDDADDLADALKTAAGQLMDKDMLTMTQRNLKDVTALNVLFADATESKYPVG